MRLRLRNWEPHLIVLERRWRRRSHGAHVLSANVSAPFGDGLLELIDARLKVWRMRIILCMTLE